MPKLEAPMEGVDSDALQHAVHELRVHQIELQAQNEELREIQQELEAARDRYAELYDFAPVAYLSFDRHGRVTDANLAAARLLGRERARLLDYPFSLWMHKPDIGLFFAHLRAVFGGQNSRHEFKVNGANGQVIDVYIESVATPVEANSIRGCRSVVLDITERKRIEAQLRRQQIDLAHANRLHTAGELASSMAHELNQPLATIVSYCETCLQLLHAGDTDAQNVTHILTQLVGQAQRASAIVRHLRGFVVRKEATPHLRMDLNALIREVVAFLQPELDVKGCRLRLELAADLPAVWADRLQIEQVLINLVLNSAEAMAHGVPEGARELTLCTQLCSAGKLQVTVRDTGPGLDAEASDQIFTSFYTTKSAGMGMGLSISRSLIEAHAGRLWAEPHPSHGAVFHFTLPLGHAE